MALKGFLGGLQTLAQLGLGDDSAMSPSSMPALAKAFTTAATHGPFIRE
jgi:hypothetical protein